jgi:two-component system sensor histidine kinase ChiS
MRLNYKLREKLQAQIAELNDHINTTNTIESTTVVKDLASRTALLVDVSHEMRSPLQGIVSISEILSTKWENIEDSVRKKQVTVISEASIELIKFVNDLLNYEKFNAGKMVFDFSELSLSNMVKQTLEYCGRLYLFDKDITLNFDNHQTGEAMIYGDHDRIKQLIMNLFINAIKYSDHGEIRASLELKDFDGESYFEFNLIDQGPGIPPEEINGIFEPFTRSVIQTTNKKVGSGLGLAMCKQIVEAHHGEIWAENNGGKGSKFSFTIPVLDKKTK